MEMNEIKEELILIKNKVEDTLNKLAEKFECSCIKCGHTLTTDQHCNTLKCPECGGDMRRKDRPGPGQPTQQEKAELRALMEKADIKEETIKEYLGE